MADAEKKTKREKLLEKEEKKRDETQTFDNKSSSSDMSAHGSRVRFA